HEEGVEDGAASPDSREERGKGAPDFPGANDAGFLLPTGGFGDAVADPSEQDGGNAAYGEHGAPAVAAANGEVREGGQENAHIVARVHVTCAGAAAGFGSFLGDEGAAHGP